MNKTRIVYIIGDNRSGSTLLDYLLASHPKAVSVGELHHLYGHYYKKGIGKSWEWKCSCGQYVRDCEFWSIILKDISFNESFKTDLKIPSYGQLEGLINIFFSKRILKDERVAEQGKIMAENRWKIYNSIAKNTNKNIIIDSSKDVEEAYFLNKYKKGDIYFLFLNRSIHEVALSKKNRIKEAKKEIKSFYGKKEHSIFKLILSTYKVLRRNKSILKIIEKSSKKEISRTIDYVELSTKPEEEILKICEFLNISKFDVPKKTNVYKTLPHILGGSPSRYKSKPITPDSRWKSYYKSRKLALTLSRVLEKV